MNGLQHIYSAGSATLEGKPVEWDLTIVKGGTKVLAVMALCENLDEDVVQRVYSTIRRLQPHGPSRIKGHGPEDTATPDAPEEGDTSEPEEEGEP